MKIIALQAENIKKIVAIEIHPDSNFVQITGKNGQGKTSALDCIWWALEGAKHIQAIPIRKGSTEARIRLDLGELIVTRTFELKDEGEITTKLVVTNAEGTILKKPQDVLDKLIGSLSFDPLDFTRRTPVEQFNILARFVADVDFKGIAEANKKDYDTRTDINRRMKEARVAASQIVVTVDEFANPVDETDLVNQMQEAGEKNALIQVDQENRNNKGKRIFDLNASSAKIVEEIRNMEESIKAKVKENTLINKEIESLQNELNSSKIPNLVDVSELKQKIADAKAVNAQIAAREEKEEYETQAKELEEQSRLLTVAMDKRETDKQNKIAKSNLPVKGVTFGDNQILLNEVPFDQGSYAEQLRASIAIAMALNPNIKVIRVDEASSMDEDSLMMVKQLSIEKDFQIWLSRTDSSGKVGVVLESGYIKDQPKKEEAPEDF